MDLLAQLSTAAAAAPVKEKKASQKSHSTDPILLVIAKLLASHEHQICDLLDNGALAIALRSKVKKDKVLETRKNWQATKPKLPDDAPEETPQPKHPIGTQRCLIGIQLLALYQEELAAAAGKVNPASQDPGEQAQIALIKNANEAAAALLKATSDEHNLSIHRLKPKHREPHKTDEKRAWTWTLTFSHYASDAYKRNWLILAAFGLKLEGMSVKPNRTQVGALGKALEEWIKKKGKKGKKSGDEDFMDAEDGDGDDDDEGAKKRKKGL